MPWRRVPLRRRSDRIQAWLTLAVIVTALLAAPGAAWWTARSTYGAEARASEWEARHRRAVSAVLEQNAAGVSSTVDSEALPGPEYVPVAARWTAPDGTVRAGAVPVEAGARAGSTVTVWIDELGALASPPRRRNAVLDATVAGTFALTAMLAFLGGARRLVIWRLDRRRLRSWEAEWQIIGPRWSRR
ncbi:Rv1733c family protein [Actinoplanes nipponensis]